MATAFIKNRKLNIDGTSRKMLALAGGRNTSKTPLLNSGSSSKKSTPLWESEISLGCGYEPPPTRATSEIV